MRGPGKERLMVCESCGAEFHACNERQGAVLCRKCQNRKYKMQYKMRKALQPSNHALSVVAAQARAAHMTYGQYVATMGGRICLTQ